VEGFRRDHTAVAEGGEQEATEARRDGEEVADGIDRVADSLEDVVNSVADAVAAFDGESSTESSMTMVLLITHVKT